MEPLLTTTTENQSIKTWIKRVVNNNDKKNNSKVLLSPPGNHSNNDDSLCQKITLIII